MAMKGYENYGNNKNNNNYGNNNKLKIRSKKKEWYGKMGGKIDSLLIDFLNVLSLLGILNKQF